MIVKIQRPIFVPIWVVYNKDRSYVAMIDEDKVPLYIQVLMGEAHTIYADVKLDSLGGLQEVIKVPDPDWS